MELPRITNNAPGVLGYHQSTGKVDIAALGVTKSPDRTF
jgi:hypothetical protein